MSYLCHYYFETVSEKRIVCSITAANTEYLEKFENLLATWSKQIEQVLAESEQMRREADDIGPTAELAYWKSRMAKFNKYAKRLSRTAKQH